MAAPKFVDVTKKTIMNMLRVDHFGFSPAELENKIKNEAKEIYHLVNDQTFERPAKFVNGVGRTDDGYIKLYQFSVASTPVEPVSKKKAKK